MEDKKKALINQVTAGCAYLNLLDELKNTDCYRGILKQRINLLNTDLKKYLNIDLKDMWGTGDVETIKILYKIIKGWQDIFVYVGNLQPEYVSAVAEMMQRMTTDPEGMLKLFNELLPDEIQEGMPAETNIL